jgi:hypothetical protein
MKRPKIRHPFGRQRGDYYLATDIDPLLDELEQMKAEKKPFPSLEEFTKWYQDNTEFLNWGVSFYLKPILQYFSQFQYEKTVFPKVGDMVEGESIHSGTTEKGEIDCTVIKGRSGNHFYIKNIRPVTTPTREEVIKSINNKLENGTDKITFDRELVEQFLNILKGQDDE